MIMLEKGYISMKWQSQYIGVSGCEISISGSCNLYYENKSF